MKKEKHLTIILISLIIYSIIIIYSFLINLDNLNISKIIFSNTPIILIFTILIPLFCFTSLKYNKKSKALNILIANECFKLAYTFTNSELFGTPNMLKILSQVLYCLLIYTYINNKLKTNKIENIIITIISILALIIYSILTIINNEIILLNILQSLSFIIYFICTITYFTTTKKISKS